MKPRTLLFILAVLAPLYANATSMLCYSDRGNYKAEFIAQPNLPNRGGNIWEVKTFKNGELVSTVNAYAVGTDPANACQDRGSIYYHRNDQGVTRKKLLTFTAGGKSAPHHCTVRVGKGSFYPTATIKSVAVQCVSFSESSAYPDVCNGISPLEP